MMTSYGGNDDTMSIEMEENEEEPQRIFDSHGQPETPPVAPADDVTVKAKPTPLIERAQRFSALGRQMDQGGEAQASANVMILLGQYIRELRQSRELSRSWLAQTARMDTEMLFRLENGLLTTAEIETVLPSIAPLLGTTVQALMARSEGLDVNLSLGENDDELHSNS